MMRSLVIYTTIAIGIVTASYDERRLYEDLMRDYNSLERPVANHSKPVTVYLKVRVALLCITTALARSSRAP